MKDYSDIAALDDASQEVDDILDSLFANSDIPADALREFLEDLEYRLGVASKSLRDT